MDPILFFACVALWLLAVGWLWLLGWGVLQVTKHLNRVAALWCRLLMALLP